MAAMEKRGLHPALGTFKEVEGITPDRLRDIVGYMNGTKSTLPGLKKIIKDVKKAQMWSWHILHPEAVTNGLVNNTTGMFWSNRGLYSNRSTDLAEISASLCVVQLMHNRSPPLCYHLSAATIGTIHMAKRQCAIASHLKVAYGSWTWTEENPWPPWSAVIKAPLWKEPKYQGLRGLLQKPVAKPVCEKSDTGLVSIQCARESLVESSTGKLFAESGRVELMAMRCGVPVPSIISSLPFAACVIEVPRLYTAGLHNLVAQLLLSGVPVFIAGESADVKATVAALKANVAEDMYQCDVALYNLSSKTPLYTSTSHLVSICSATAFDNRLPR